jgi:hypothetical protein
VLSRLKNVRVTLSVNRCSFRSCDRLRTLIITFLSLIQVIRLNMFGPLLIRADLAFRIIFAGLAQSFIEGFIFQVV